MSATGIITDNAAMFSMTPAARYYLFKPSATPENLYLTAGIGPYFGHERDAGVTSAVFWQVKMRTVFGGFLGGGMDIRLSHRLSLYVDAAYHKLAHFPSGVGTGRDCSGPAVSVGLGWQFGGPVLKKEEP